MTEIKPDRIIFINPETAAQAMARHYWEAGEKQKARIRSEIRKIWEEAKRQPIKSYDERILQLVLQHRRECLTDALNDCLGQRLNKEDAEANGEYRRGQYRGADDCVTMVERLLKGEP